MCPWQCFQYIWCVAFDKSKKNPYIQGTNMHCFMPMANLIEIFIGKNHGHIMIKVLFSAPIPYRSLSVLIIPLLHILSAPSLECFPSVGGKLWKLNENRTYWVELSAPQITLIVQNSIWKFWELQIIWSKQKLDTFCNIQLCLVTNSAAKLVFENDKSYQGISLSLPSLLGLHFLHEYGAFGLSIPSVSEIQEKYDRMKIFK